MKVHHLNCGSMQAPGAPMVCHVLLLETAGGLVLVDSGFGLDDIAHTRERLGLLGPLLAGRIREEETAIRQVEALGFQGEDVRHIVITHFDPDHIGGLSDFPNATVHTTAAEILAAVTDPDRRAKARFRASQWAHGPHLVEHTLDGEAWRGFAAAKELDDIAPGIVMISVPGHTRGHAAIAIDTGDHWLLHAGDAFYHRSTIEGGKAPLVVRIMERITTVDRAQLLANRARLAELHQRGEPDLTVFCAHDPVQFEKARGEATK